jgi:4-amino-4-deoxy-L-arabinose transferase-like glycosyltransferase
MLRNYWPWFPVTVVGVFLFAKNSFKEKDYRSIFLFLWVLIPFVVMSTSRNQTLRYLFMIFPAFAIITAHTLGSWLKDSQKEKALPWMIGIIMATVLVINVTPIQTKVSLNYNSAEARDIAPFINANTSKKQGVFFYKLSWWNPTQALMFYSDRVVEGLSTNPEKLFKMMRENDGSTWLAGVPEFKNLEKEFPGKFYLIYANQKFAYFTLMQNREKVVYNFSKIKIPVVR